MLIIDPDVCGEPFLLTCNIVGQFSASMCVRYVVLLIVWCAEAKGDKLHSPVS